MIFSVHLFFIGLFCLSIATAHATVRLDEMIVTGTSEPDKHNIIDQKEITQKQYQDAKSLFKSHPSLEVNTSGGLTTLSIRGTSAQHNIVMINGLVVGDPSADNQFDFSTLDPGDIEKIEIITSAKALYYGSGALGGVIKITTKKAGKKKRATGQLEAGSFRTKKVKTSFSNRTPKTGFHGHLYAEDAGSKRRFNSHHGTYNADANDNLSGSVFLDTQLTKRHTMELYLQGETSHTDIDDYVTGLPQAKGSSTKKQVHHIALTNHLTTFQDRWHHTLIIGHKHIERSLRSEFPGPYSGERFSLDYDTSFDVNSWMTLNGGVNTTRDKDQVLNTPHRTLDQKSLRAKIDLFPLDSLEVFISGRLDKHDYFKTHPTGQMGFSLDIKKKTTLAASLGTGFKAPSSQTFLGFSNLQNPNPNAKPEKSLLWDITLAHRFPKQNLITQLTYFQNRIKDVLTWDQASKMMSNKDRRHIQGIEISLHQKINKNWIVKGSFTYTKSLDYPQRIRALKVPKRKTALSLSYDPSNTLSFFAEAVHKSSQMDYPQKKLKPLLDLRLGGQYNWTKKVTFFGRIENALNEKKEESYGYGRRGFGIFGGLKLKT